MPIESFCGRYSFLSNFSPSPVSLDGERYPTVEHAYQAAKTLDRDRRAEVRRAVTPNVAKKIGRRVKLRPDWEERKLAVMESLLRQKFSDPALRASLLGTGDEPLIEVNYWHDTYWGVCNGHGENHLGKLLMMLRAEYRAALPT